MPRIVGIRERSVPISRYADPAIPSGGLTTSIVAIATDAVRDGARVVGYGFSSIGRYAQTGLIRERFAPRLLAAAPAALAAKDDATTIDPFRAWSVMMAGEKPGGHGERCVAVGTLDMALWDLTAKIAGLPLHRFMRGRIGASDAGESRVAVYAGGGYPYPHDDIGRLVDETQRARDLGYTNVKIKVGAARPADDVARIEAAAAAIGSPAHLAVDAMNAYDPAGALRAAEAFAPLGLWWFEDLCDPLDFAAWAAVARRYAGPIAAGEALFSASEAELLARHGGLRTDRDILLFDPVHCYGVPGYRAIVERMTARGWPKRAFWPHGGHLFTLHVAAAFGLAGAELNPFSFQPFGGIADDMCVSEGGVELPDRPGIGFEHKRSAGDLFAALGPDDVIA